MQFKANIVSVSIAMLALVSGGVMAAEMSKAGKPLTPQQARMVDCNKQATGKKGDERKTFMSSCLKGETTAAAPTQQSKMKTCNAEAKTKALKGADRKAFMSSCLKGDAPPAAAPASDGMAAAPAKSSQREKMKSCNAEAKTKELKGADRKAFMSTCLHG